MKQLSVIVIVFVVLFVVFFATYPGCYARARMLELMGVNEPAKNTYNKIKERAPDTQWADRSEERLALLTETPAPEDSEDAETQSEKPEPTPRPSLAEQAVMPMEEAQRIQSPPAAVKVVPPAQPAAPKQKPQEPKQERRIEPSYGGPLGAYHHSKNKINDIQKKHNKDLMKQMQD